MGKGVQEQFLEYAHYLPERSVQAAVERQRVAAFSALEGIQLTQPVSVAEVCRPLPRGQWPAEGDCRFPRCLWGEESTPTSWPCDETKQAPVVGGSQALLSCRKQQGLPACFPGSHAAGGRLAQRVRELLAPGEQVLGCLEGMSAEFEEAVALGGGWAQLALPSPEDAQRYFTSFRRAPPDNSALVPGPQARCCSWPHAPIACALCLRKQPSLDPFNGACCPAERPEAPLAAGHNRGCCCSVHDRMTDCLWIWQVAIPDEDIVRALVEEVVHVMSGPLFDAALKVRRTHPTTTRPPGACSASGAGLRAHARPRRRADWHRLPLPGRRRWRR